MIDQNITDVPGLARSRATRAIVVDVFAGALWQLLRAERVPEPHVPTTRPSRLLRPVPTVSQLLEFSGS